MTKRLRDVTALGVVILLCLVLASPVGAAEFQEGRLRLTLHEDVGRFSISYLRDLRREDYVPLFYAQDPRTSVISVTDGEQVHRLGDAGVFTLRTETEGDSPAFLFRSSSLEVRQRFTFVSSPNARLANGVRMDLTITNTSERSADVGVRVLLDTHLSENRGEHFAVAGGRAIGSETALEPGASTPYWTSMSDRYEDVGLQYMLSGSSVTVPERVVFANWKRLSDSRYDYTTRSGRSFSLLPYSINDSAVAVYYSQETVGPGASRTITTYLGNYDEAGFGDAGRQSDLAGMLDSENVGEEPATEDALLQELVAVDDVMEEIDRLLANPEEASSEDIELINRLLDQLEARKDAISDQ
ncbi:MAG: hypothetical protein ACOCYG_06345 [Spirochaetota bacterium]